MTLRSVWRNVVCLLFSAVLITGLWACGKDGPAVPAGPAGTSGNSPGESVSLPEFCDDPALNAWFAALEDGEAPVRLDYWIYGYAPYNMVFTEQELILEAALALEQVRIGDVSAQDPDLVSDGGGFSYDFEMADGSSYTFYFPLGCFRWGDKEYHDVAGFGDITEINRRLEKIGNPQYVISFSEDGGFYTRHLETYTTEWRDEWLPLGGLVIYTEENGKAPYVSVRLVDMEVGPEEYLTEVLPELLWEDREELGLTITELPEEQGFTAGKESLPGAVFRLEAPDGTVYRLQAVAKVFRDDLLEEEHLVSFCALSEESEEEDQRLSTALEDAVREFVLRRAGYEKGEVQPDSLLLDFCNDEGLRQWFEKAAKRPPDELTYVEDTWYIIDDPEAVLRILDALKTVRIGGVSDAHVGGSGRQIFDFSDRNTGNSMEFMFFQNTFDYDGKSYDVLDWGELKNIDIKGAASHSAND